MDRNFSLIESDQKAKAYSGLARYYAASNDGWFAVHAQIESDLFMTVFLLESYNFDVEAISQAIAEKIAVHDIEATSASNIIGQIRSIIRLSLPEDILSVWDDNLTNTEMFNHLEEISSENSEKMAETRMHDLSVEEFIKNRYADAEEHMGKAKDFLDSGNEWEAIVAAYAADLASFEGWLFERSFDLDDSAYTQAEMAWALAMASLENISELPNDFAEASALVRSRLVWVAGIKEGKNLAKIFETI